MTHAEFDMTFYGIMHWYKALVHKVGIFASLKADAHRATMQQHVRESLDHIEVAIQDRIKLSVDEPGRLHDLKLTKQHVQTLRKNLALMSRSSKKKTAS